MPVYFIITKKVLKSSQKYSNVHTKVPKSKLLRASKSTQKNSKVPKSNQKYSNVQFEVSKFEVSFPTSNNKFTYFSSFDNGRCKNANEFSSATKWSDATRNLS